MRRLLSITLSFLAVVTIATALAWWKDGELSRQIGKDRDYLRSLSKREHENPRSTHALVVWMGDSTMVTHPDNVAYEERVSRALGPRVDRIYRILPGLAFYHHYLMMPDVLDADPDLVVANVNLRIMDPSFAQPLNGLESLIPVRELPRAFTLPFHAVGMTIPHLLFARLYRIPAIEHTLHFYFGLRQRLYDATFWEAAIGETIIRAKWIPDGAGRPYFAAYDHEISRADPMVRMISATVDLAARNGVPMLVLVSPIPWERLQKFDLYDPDRADRRVFILREMVEEAGGRLVDLHDLLSDDEFTDSSGHVTSSGNQRIHQALLPVVREMLGQTRLRGSENANHRPWRS